VPDALRRYLQPREGWLSWAFLFTMLLSLGWSVQRAGWIPQDDFVVPVAFWGALLGASLGLTRLRVLFVLPLSALAGAGVVLWAVGGEYFTELSKLGRLAALRTEAIVWTRAVLEGASPSQLSPYAIGMGTLMWVTAFIAAYAIYRHHRVFDAILLVGVTLIVNMSATFTDLFAYIVLFSVAALLLWLRTALVSREERWQVRSVAEHADVHGSMLSSGITFIIGSIALAWILTTVAVAAPLTGAWSNLDDTWSTLRNDFSNVFGGVTAPDSRISGFGFGTSFAVRGRWVSSDTEVMTVAAKSPYYMRTITYDTYTGHGWSSSDGTERTVAAGDRIFPAATPERPVAKQGFTTETVSIEIQNSVGRNVFTPGFPEAAFTPVIVRQPGGKPLLGSLDSAVPLEPGRGYQITAVISNVTEAMLAGAGTDYPPDITATYLGINGVTDRTQELARSIVQAAGATDPYHEARALAAYLQTNPRFHYATVAPLPTDPTHDLVDFFLFDPMGQTGYCEYYASAMAVMARTLGLPARVAVGYAPGERVKEGVYEYRQLNAHAWAEIYFPGYGWQIFEATKSIRPLVRPSGAGVVPPVASQPGGVDNGVPHQVSLGDVSSLPSFNPVDGGFKAGGARPTDQARGGALIVGTALLALLVLVAAWRLLAQRRYLRFMAPGDRQWQRLAWAANRAGVSRAPSETIYEYANWLEEALPAHRTEIRQIANGKVWQAYSGRSMTADAIALLEHALARLQLPLVRLAIRRRLGAFFSRGDRG
jgi:transglutaminase-like putative cysteine protease